ncbi:MAG TPA: polysaccharide deacetylase family protein [Candidatus Acidoferrum sp.]|nr:polysaccharide deacetylase family protein [Candidatus Acidoferrum sp.]
MSPRALAVILLLSVFCALNGRAQSKSVAERLGYPADAKLLIVHADDLAVAHSVNAASFAALDTNAVTSASIMIPCAWLTEVAAYARAHPNADLGLHLTLTSEWKTYRWGPVESTDKVPSLLAPDGYLWPETQPAAQNIKAEEAEREIRAQIQRAIALGIRPTHLDSHMGTLFATPQLFSVLVKVAHEYKLPFLAVKVTDERSKLLSLLSEKDVVLDSLVMADPSITPGSWEQFYASAIRNLKPGLTEMIVHLGHDDAELQAVTVDHPDYGSAWRQRDLDFVSSPAFKKLLTENHVILIQWRDLGKLLQ